MNPNGNKLFGDHYGYGQINNNPTSSLTNAPKGQMISDAPKVESGISAPSGLGSSGIGGYPASSNTINDHNHFAQAQNMAKPEEIEPIKEGGNVKIVLIIGAVLLALIVISILTVIVLRYIN